MNISRTAFVVFVSRLGSSVIGFFGMVLFINILGGKVFGTFLLFEGVVSILAIFVDFGINDAVEKRISGGKASNILVTAAVMKVSLLIPIGILILIFDGRINVYFGTELALLLVPAILVREQSKVVLNSLRGELRVQEATLIEALNRFAYVVTGLALALLGFEVTALLGGYFTGWGLQLLVGLRASSIPLGFPKGEIARSLFEFSKYNFVASVLGGKAYSWADTLLIGLFLTQTHVTAYETAWRISTLTVILSQSIANTLFPQVSDWSADQSFELIERTIPKALTGSLLFVIPAIPGSLILGPPVLRFSFSSELMIAALPLMILMVGKVAQSVNDIVGRILLGLNRPDLTARSAVVFIMTNVSLNVLLIAEYGIAGAAAATSIAFFLNAGMNTYFLSNLLDVRVNAVDIVVCSGAAVLMAVLIEASKRIVVVGSLGVAALLILLGIVIYFGILLLNPSLRMKMYSIVEDITNRS